MNRADLPEQGEGLREAAKAVVDYQGMKSARLVLLIGRLDAALAASPAPEPPSLYRCINCGRDEHGCECIGGGTMEAAAAAPEPPSEGLDAERLRARINAEVMDVFGDTLSDERLNRALTAQESRTTPYDWVTIRRIEELLGQDMVELLDAFVREIIRQERGESGKDHSPSPEQEDTHAD